MAPANSSAAASPAPIAWPLGRSKIAHSPARVLVAVPVAIAVAFGIHCWAARNQPAPETNSYAAFLAVVLVGSIMAIAMQSFWMAGRRWLEQMGPIIAVAILLLGAWEIITSGLRW